MEHYAVGSAVNQATRQIGSVPGVAVTPSTRGRLAKRSDPPHSVHVLGAHLRRRSALLALLVCTAQTPRGFAQPRAIDASTNAPLSWRAFEPLQLALGDGDACATIAYLRAAHALTLKADGPIEEDAATRDFRSKALASIADFDLAEFYQRLPQRDGAFRTFSYEGTPLARGYRFTVGRGRDYEVNASGNRRAFGELSGAVRMRHLEAEDRFRYLMEFRAGVGVGPLSFSALERGFADALRSLAERPDLRALPLFVQTLASRSKREHPSLHDEDRALLALASASFPQLMQLFASIIQMEDLVVASAQAGTTSVRAIMRVDLGRLSAENPALSAYLRRFGNLLQGRARLKDAQGATWADFAFDSARLRVQLQFFVRDGAVVPSQDGVAIVHPAQAPRGLHLVTDLHLQQYGLHMYLDALDVELSGERHATGASLAVQIRRTPRFRAEGAVFGLFPSSMLDWFVPGDIEGLARRMMDVTMKGNGGKGVLMTARFERPEGRLATIDGTAGLEILDTRLIRFGMKIAADRVMPDDAAERELARLVRRARDALHADVERFARFAIPADTCH